METTPPSYQTATTRDAWSVIARYIPSSDLCAATLVCRRWHQIFMPFLWGDPASHFGTDNDAVYVALTRFRRTLKYASLGVRMLTHTLHLPPALSEIYGGPRPEWLREILERLPCLQSLIVSKLPFFDHNAMMALKGAAKTEHQVTYNVRLLLADHEPNTTSTGLAETLLRFHELIYLDLSYTTPARDQIVLSALSQLEHLQVLKLRGIGLKDQDAEFLANAIGLRVRFLDLRNNYLTDMAVRSLLQASFSPQDRSSTAQSHISSPTTRLLRNPSLDEQFMKTLTQPLTGRLWVEDLPHVGVTHLYIADNQITVEGVAGLLASSCLHALDVGTVDTARSLTKGQLSLPSAAQEDLQALPGSEKLIPILGSAAKENLTYLRGHHLICTADAPLKEPESPHAFLPELATESNLPVPQEAELDVSHGLHELPGSDPIFELPGDPVPPASGSSTSSREIRREPNVYEDEPLPLRRRGSVFAPEVVQADVKTGDVSSSEDTTFSMSPMSQSRSIRRSDSHLETLDSVQRCPSPLPLDDVRSQKIQELLSKRPKNQSIPRRDGRKTSLPYLHPSHVPHLETLVLTDVPSHVPANSAVLRSIIRFITACSNEALLATLQAGSDYSLPPGQARARAEQERARSLFSLRRLVLEVTPVDRSARPVGLTAWKPLSYHSGVSKSSTGDRDLENLWSAAMDDFSFFGEDECGVPQNDPGKYFPMAVLNEKVSLIPEDDDFNLSNASETDLSPGSGTFLPSRRSWLRSRPDSVTSVSQNMRFTPTGKDGQCPPQLEEPVIDVVAELAAFRRAKKAEYEELVRSDRKRRSTINASSPGSLLSPSSPALRSPSPSPSLTTLGGGVTGPMASMAHFVEGHWKGEVKIVRNAAPKGRSGMVDMYGNYFEKGYLYP
ncbi:leucine rich repeat domain protein [Aspergillus ambiguus]|uniref:leucine rich repeat domain protein n=1 Tax=Aspergillus ambiguus TaxID=176160 RepID=UPI003CCDBA82